MRWALWTKSSLLTYYDYYLFKDNSFRHILSWNRRYMASECEIFDNLVYRLVHYKRQEDVLA